MYLCICLCGSCNGQEREVPNDDLKKRIEGVQVDNRVI